MKKTILLIRFKTIFNFYYIVLVFLFFLTSCGSSGIKGRWVREGQGLKVEEFNEGGEYISYQYDGSIKDLVEEKRGKWEVKDDSLYVTDVNNNLIQYTSKIKIESGVMENCFKNNNGQTISINYLSYSGLNQLKSMRKGNENDAWQYVQYKAGPCWGSVRSVEEVTENTYKVIFDRTTYGIKLSPYFGCECCYEPLTKTVMVYYNPETNDYKADL